MFEYYKYNNTRRITVIGTNAFNCIGITSMIIPDTVTSIGRSVFSGCSNLASVKLSNNLPRIDNACFSSCTSLTEINIPDSVTALGGTAFQKLYRFRKSCDWHWYEYYL